MEFSYLHVLLHEELQHWKHLTTCIQTPDLHISHTTKQKPELRDELKPSFYHVLKLLHVREVATQISVCLQRADELGADINQARRKDTAE